LKVPKGKRAVLAYISDDLYKKLIELAPQMYGKGRGGISHVIEEALRHYLLPRASANTHTNPKLSIRDVFSNVVMRLRDRYGFTPKEVPEYELDQAISEARGYDKRTIDKWKSAFEKSGLIKYIGGFKPKRIVELIGAMACP